MAINKDQLKAIFKNNQGEMKFLIDFMELNSLPFQIDNINDLEELSGRKMIRFDKNNTVIRSVGDYDNQAITIALPTRLTISINSKARPEESVIISLADRNGDIYCIRGEYRGDNITAMTLNVSSIEYYNKKSLVCSAQEVLLKHQYTGRAIKQSSPRFIHTISVGNIDIAISTKIRDGISPKRSIKFSPDSEEGSINIRDLFEVDFLKGIIHSKNTSKVKKRG